MIRHMFIISILILLALKGFSKGQAENTGSNESQIKIKAKKADGGMLLKIVPQQTDAFIHLKKKGWNIKRASVEEGDTGSFRQLNNDPIKPATRDQWDSMQKDNETTEAIKEVLYPDQPEKAPTTFMEKIEDHTRMNNQHFLYLFLSAENRKISKASGLEYRDRNANLDQKFIYQAEIAGFEDSTVHYGQTTVLGTNIPEKYHAPELNGGSLDSAALLFWNHTDYDEQFISYRLERSPEGDHFKPVHKKLLEKNKTNYLDPSAGPGNDHYYAVAAFDTAGNYSISDGTSAAIRDTVAPAPPRGLEASVDSNGVLTLTWDLGKAEDLAGYRVYRSVSKNYEFTQVTDTPTVYTGWKDTLNLASLNDELYYKVVAVDNQYIHSSYSQVIEVTKPDTIAPTKALLTEAIYNNGKVKLTWEPSSSEDATKQYILQRTNQQSDWKTVDSLSNTERKHYQHRPEKKASAYYYAIQTQDDNGLKSGRSNVMQVADPNYTEIPAPENLEAHVTEDQNIQLTWDQPEKVKDYRMMIYRSKGENAPLLYEIIDQSGQKFTDEDVSAGTYQYRIAIKRNSDGLLSKQSNKEKVTMKP